MKTNKVEFIRILSQEFKNQNFDMLKPKSDSDTLTVSEALDTRCKGREVQVITEDTDVKIMLRFFFNAYMTNLIIKSFNMKNV